MPSSFFCLLLLAQVPFCVSSSSLSLYVTYLLLIAGPNPITTTTLGPAGPPMRVCCVLQRYNENRSARFGTAEQAELAVLHRYSRISGTQPQEYTNNVLARIPPGEPCVIVLDKNIMNI